MTALLLAAALTAGSGPVQTRQVTPALGYDRGYDFDTTTSSADGPSVKLILVRSNWDTLLYIDGDGTLHLVRWCTPWEVAEAWLAGLPRREDEP